MGGLAINFAFEGVRTIEVLNQTREFQKVNKCMIFIEKGLPLRLILNLVKVMQ
jgi:hypothetical protein